VAHGLEKQEKSLNLSVARHYVAEFAMRTKAFVVIFSIDNSRSAVYSIIDSYKGNLQPAWSSADDPRHSRTTALELRHMAEPFDLAA
jgi:hypothetical protein